MHWKRKFSPIDCTTLKSTRKKGQQREEVETEETETDSQSADFTQILHFHFLTFVRFLPASTELDEPIFRSRRDKKTKKS